MTKCLYYIPGPALVQDPYRIVSRFLFFVTLNSRNKTIFSYYVCNIILKIKVCGALLVIMFLKYAVSPSATAEKELFFLIYIIGWTNNIRKKCTQPVLKSVTNSERMITLYAITSSSSAWNTVYFAITHGRQD